MTYITEPSREIPVIYDADICVVGGSCTGVFAAVRAARLGAKVVLVEKQNRLGGVATAGLVNIWHSLYSTDYSEQIIAGLTDETVQRLKSANAIDIQKSEAAPYHFNPQILTCELDELIKENNIKLYLHTFYAGMIKEEGISAILVENKDGRGAIRAKFFIDATGDGDLMRDVGAESYRFDFIQPPTSCFYLQGDTKDADMAKLITEHGHEFGLDDDWGWNDYVPGLHNILMRADNHVFGVHCEKADDRTKAEMTGRRQAYALTKLFQKYHNPECEIVSFCSEIGIRDTVHYKTNYTVTEKELLTGEKFEDTILKGSYRIDVHHSQDNGITFKYLDGRKETFYGKGSRAVKGNWREEEGITGSPATYYSFPFRAMVHNYCHNLICAGRMLNADQSSFGALRVMVNLNQMGEAAGVAAYMAINEGKKLPEIDGVRLRELLKKGGSAL